MNYTGYITTTNMTSFHGVLARQFDIPDRNNIYGTNPCRRCPNFDVDAGGCILGEGECDREDNDET